MRILSVLLCLSAVIFAASAGARTWHVPGNAPTIQAGIDSASAGDTVLVACGTYYEHDIETKSQVCLRSETGQADCVTIDAQQLGSVLRSTYYSGPTTLEGLTLTGGDANIGGGFYCTSYEITVSNCVFTDNSAWGGGGMWSTGGVTFIDCVFSDNTASIGGGIANQEATLSLNGCLFTNNSAARGGGVYLWGFTWPSINHSSFVGNSAATSGGGVFGEFEVQGSFTHCTFFANSSPTGGGIMLEGSSLLHLDNTIIAFCPEGEAVGFGENYRTDVTFACSDIFGNVGGDWVGGGLPGQYGVDGNISADPQFCDAAGGDLYLSSTSPCLYDSCGQIGAFVQGCLGEAPRIMSILDVDNDQGRAVRLSWQRSRYDAGGDTVEVTGYGIYRRQNQAGRPGNGRAEGWDYIDTAPARGDSLYQFVAPTLCDSTASGICWSAFFVSAMTPDPLVYFDSPPDSGYSIDNLEPGPPQNLRWETEAILAWDEAEEEDFDYFSVYGSASAEFGEDAELIRYTVGTNMDVSETIHLFYHVTATDMNGNEGGAATVATTVAVPDALVPRVIALGPCRPNPFSASTTLSLDLPEPATVTCRVFDVSGRLVRTVADDRRPAGQYRLVWDGADSRGSIVPGVYFVRVEADRFTAVRRVILLNGTVRRP